MIGVIVMATSLCRYPAVALQQEVSQSVVCHWRRQSLREELKAMRKMVDDADKSRKAAILNMVSVFTCVYRVTLCSSDGNSISSGSSISSSCFSSCSYNVVVVVAEMTVCSSSGTYSSSSSRTYSSSMSSSRTYSSSGGGSRSMSSSRCGSRSRSNS